MSVILDFDSDIPCCHLSFDVKFHLEAQELFCSVSILSQYHLLSGFYDTWPYLPRTHI